MGPNRVSSTVKMEPALRSGVADRVSNSLPLTFPASSDSPIRTVVPTAAGSVATCRASTNRPKASRSPTRASCGAPDIRRNPPSASGTVRSSEERWLTA